MSFAGLTALGEMKKSNSQKNLMKANSLKPLADRHSRSFKSPPPNGPTQSTHIGAPPELSASERAGAFGRSVSAPAPSPAHAVGGSREAQELREKLAECLESENYEEAAVLRDRLRALGESSRQHSPKAQNAPALATSGPQGRALLVGAGSWKGPETPKQSSFILEGIRKTGSWRGEMTFPSPPPGFLPDTSGEHSMSSSKRGGFSWGGRTQSGNSSSQSPRKTGSHPSPRKGPDHHPHAHSVPLPDTINPIDNHPPSSVCAIM